MSVMDNLARDAARALAAGQTYGKWKAEHPNTKDDLEEIEIKPTVTEREKYVPKCDVCGNPIPKGSRYRLRCGPECSRIATKRRMKQRRNERKCQ